MSGRKLATLALILVVLGLAAYLSRKPSETKRGDIPGSGDKLFANLDVNAVALIEIQADGKTNTIGKQEDTWVVGSLYDYPADRSKVVERLRGLVFLKIGQLMRGGDKILDEFGLGEAKNSIRFLDEAGTELAALNIGDSRTPKSSGQSSGPGNFGSFPDGRYISTDGSNVILIEDSLSAWIGDGDNWVKKQLLSVNGSDIATITVSSNDVAYTLSFEGSETKLADLAEDEKLDSGNAGRVQRALSYLSFETVADPALADEETGLDNPVTYRAKDTDGIVYELKVGGTPADGGDTRYARVDVSYEELPPPTREDAEALVPSEPEPEENGEDDASEETDAPPQKTRDELMQDKLDELLAEHQRKEDETKKKIEDLARLKGWTYLLSKYSAESICLGRDPLVEKIEEEEEAEEEDTADESSDSGDTAAAPTSTDQPLSTPEPEADTEGSEPADGPDESETEPTALQAPDLPPIPPAAE